MPGLVPGIHVLAEHVEAKNVDGRDKPGHDGGKSVFGSKALYPNVNA